MLQYGVCSVIKILGEQVGEGVRAQHGRCGGTLESGSSTSGWAPRYLKLLVGVFSLTRLFED